MKRIALVVLALVLAAAAGTAETYIAVPESYLIPSEGTSHIRITSSEGTETDIIVLNFGELDKIEQAIEKAMFTVAEKLKEKRDGGEFTTLNDLSVLVVEAMVGQGMPNELSVLIGYSIVPRLSAAICEDAKSVPCTAPIIDDRTILRLKPLLFYEDMCDKFPQLCPKDPEIPLRDDIPWPQAPTGRLPMMRLGL